MASASLMPNPQIVPFSATHGRSCQIKGATSVAMMSPKEFGEHAEVCFRMARIKACLIADGKLWRGAPRTPSERTARRSGGRVKEAAASPDQQRAR